MEDNVNILRRNIKQFLSSANIIYNARDFTSATILYFKTLFGVFDLVILKNLGKTPKDHSERFRILEERFPDLYSILDTLYPIYRGTYVSNINRETCDKIKENVEKIIKEQRIFEDN